jgi:hypothetical protein
MPSISGSTPYYPIQSYDTSSAGTKSSPATSFKLADQNGSKSTGAGGASTGGNTSANELNEAIQGMAESMVQSMNSDAEKLQKNRQAAKKEEDAEDDPD